MNPETPRTPREKLETRLTALLMGELQPEESAAIRALMAADPELSALHERLRKAMELLREASALPEQPAPPAPLQLSSDRREKLLAHFKTAAPAPASPSTPAPIVAMPRRNWTWIVPTGIAAAVVAILGVGMLLPSFTYVQTTADSAQLPGASLNRVVQSRNVDFLFPQSGRNGESDLRRSPSNETSHIPGNANPYFPRPQPTPALIKGGSGTWLYAPAAPETATASFPGSGATNVEVRGGTLETPWSGGGLAGAQLTQNEFHRDQPSSQLSGSGLVVTGANIPRIGAYDGGTFQSLGADQFGAFQKDATEADQKRPFLQDLNGQSDILLNGANTYSGGTTIAGVNSGPLPLFGGSTFGGGTAGNDRSSNVALGSSGDTATVTGSNTLTIHAGPASFPVTLDVRGGAPNSGNTRPGVTITSSIGTGMVAPGAASGAGVVTNSNIASNTTGSSKQDNSPAGDAVSTLGQKIVDSVAPPEVRMPVLERQIQKIYTGATPKIPGAVLVKRGVDAGDSVPQERTTSIASVPNIRKATPYIQADKSRIARQLDEATKAREASEKKQVLLEPRSHLAESALQKATNGSEEMAKLELSIMAKERNEVASKSELEEKEAAKEIPREPPAPVATPQPEVLTHDNAFSTFSLNVSDVSFKLAAASLERGRMPDPSSVRSEEFVNAFDYRDPEPAPGAPLAFASERARYPFAQNRDLLRFSVKTAAAGRQPGRPLNIVLLLDKSGSMERADRVNIVREALRVLAAQLLPQDKLSIVTFARTPRLWADGVAGDKVGDMIKRVSEITPEGGTNLEAALDLGYETALRHYTVGSISRVVLFTDGAANLGDVDPLALTRKVEAHRKKGVALDCFGIGWEGYNDDLLEQLTRNGDGRYGFINTPEEAAANFAAQLAGALQVAASDVKTQVEFNPRRVIAYRQIGYAKHQLTKEQFRDNTVNAAQIGAAESGNALYVVEVDPRGEGDLATVRVRFRVPGTTDYREHEWPVPFNGNAQPLEQSSPALRLAGTAAAFSEMLAASPYASEITSDRLLGLLNGVPGNYGADPRPKKLEWMIRQVKNLSGR